MPSPTTIKAITIPKNGDVDVIECTDVAFPEKRPDHLLVKIHYGGANFIDTYYRKGLYPVQKFPHVLGIESAGTIVGLPTDEQVLNDEEYKKRRFREGGKVAIFAQTIGQFTEYVSVPWTAALPVPPSVSLLDAAAIHVQALTAVTLMSESYAVKEGDTVLVHTVAGGLGLLFAQYAKHRGARVIGTTSTEEKAELAKAHGADHVVLYRREDTVERVLEITGGEGVDVIYDGVGKDTFDSDFAMVKRKGTIVSVGNASGAVPPFSPLRLTEKNVKLVRPTMGNYIATPAEARHYGAEVYDLVAQGVLRANIYKEYPFTADGVREAQVDLTGGKTSGKLVIRIAEA